MDCPVCGNKKISPFSPTCLECGTDVVAFPLLDEVETEYVDTLKDKVALEGDLAEMIRLRKADKYKLVKRRNRAYVLLLLMPLFFYWLGRRNVVVFDTDLQQSYENTIVNINAEYGRSVKQVTGIFSDTLTAVRGRNDTLSLALQEAYERIAELEHTTIIHIAEEADNFSDLAERYLGTEARWEEIRDINPQVKNMYNIKLGTKIRVKVKAD